MNPAYALDASGAAKRCSSEGEGELLTLTYPNPRGRAKTPLRPENLVELWMPPPEPFPYLLPQAMPLNLVFGDAHLIEPCSVTDPCTCR